jgi:hypothetical protein
MKRFTIVAILAPSQNYEKWLFCHVCLSVCVSVCLSVWNSLAATGRICMKFNV